MGKKAKAPATLTEELRAALSEAIAKGESLRGVERATGVKNPSILKFLRGDQSLRLDMADRLATHFNIVSRREEEE